ncbi:hypothetical protein [Rubrobacter indicoceani]|uniref:hypothetical protein n=1 Tax=Rubrobacter indicoceani TaxID=2051957 RepID=UPI000E5BD770|nr:hypothetical protein [Rubrobacter indicoceani]
MDNSSGNSEKSLQTLPQLQATGAVVLGSDREKVGDLGEVRDSDFTVRVEGLFKGDLNIPVNHVKEITGDDEIILDVEASRVKEIKIEKSSVQTDPAAPFSADVETERGAWGLRHKKE